MNGLLHQLYKTKLRLAGLATAVLGAGLLFIAKAVETDPTLHWLVSWPTSEVGTTLLSAGIIAIIFEYYARKESTALAAERFREVIRQEAPAIRDVVLDSLAFNPNTLKDVATPANLDRITTNALGLRLGDEHLARDLYGDLRDQVVGAPERWHDVDVSITVMPWAKGPPTGGGSMFVATVRWEYRVQPASSTMRFACVSDLAEYREMLRDQTITSAWHFDLSAGIDAASTDAFELLQLAVNGKPRPIRRTARKGAQVYAVSVGSRERDRELVVAYTYRALVQRHGHLLYLDLPRPTKGLHVQLDYTAAGIRRVNTLDYFAGTQTARVDQTPLSTPAKIVDVSFDGWVFPRSGVAFVWVLADEIQEPKLSTAG